uniref:Uncharacterized protein n=1 Tax=Glossina palpalis gambiensis TaxID=67801 RepID=A0A1B0AZH5_9MUSC
MALHVNLQQSLTPRHFLGGTGDLKPFTKMIAEKIYLMNLRINVMNNKLLNICQNFYLMAAANYSGRSEVKTTGYMHKPSNEVAPRISGTLLPHALLINSQIGLAIIESSLSYGSIEGIKAENCVYLTSDKLPSNDVPPTISGILLPQPDLINSQIGLVIIESSLSYGSIEGIKAYK